jgi:NADH-quinone oxidoreductase E subunit
MSAAGREPSGRVGGGAAGQVGAPIQITGAHRAPGEHGSAHGGHGTETAPYDRVFRGERLAQLERLFDLYPNKQACLLPALWMVQEARGWISEPAVGEVAEVLGLTPAYVKGVVTFYTMYHTHPVGRHFVQVCTTTPCNICGAEEVVKALLQHTGCGELGATSPDGRFTLIEVECLGACGFATPILIDDDFIESVTPEKVPAILQGYE